MNFNYAPLTEIVLLTHHLGMISIICGDGLSILVSFLFVLLTEGTNLECMLLPLVMDENSFQWAGMIL